MGFFDRFRKKEKPEKVEIPQTSEATERKEHKETLMESILKGAEWAKANLNKTVQKPEPIGSPAFILQALLSPHLSFKQQYG
ncbi:MAG: hypothetical protein Q4A72_04550 [Bacillota bacterium]|nr:hypothetical protein [Bacillota bacterium]